jgi:SnoaL-like domain
MHWRTRVLSRLVRLELKTGAKRMVEEWFEKLTIQEAVLRYARAVDRSDWDGVRAAYHQDAFDDHGEFKGSVDELIAWLEQRFTGAETGMHFIGNCLVEIVRADLALAETYFVSHRLRPATNDVERAQCGADGAFCRQGWGRYVDRFERRADKVWRVAQRTVVMDSIVQMTVPNALREGITVWGQRNSSDWLFQSQAMLIADSGKTES